MSKSKEKKKEYYKKIKEYTKEYGRNWKLFDNRKKIKESMDETIWEILLKKKKKRSEYAWKYCKKFEIKINNSLVHLNKNDIKRNDRILEKIYSKTYIL